MADPTQVSPGNIDTRYLAAQNAADQQLRQAFAPGPGALAAVQGLTPGGFPAPQPGQGGTLLALSNTTGAQAGIPQPQPVRPRMMGTVDPTFPNGTGAPAGFSPAALPVAPTIGRPIDTAALNASTQGAPVAAMPDASAATDNGVSPTPGEGNPLPPSMRGGAGDSAPTLTAPVPQVEGNPDAVAGGYPSSIANAWQNYSQQDHTLFDPFGRGDGTPASTAPSLASLPGGGAIANGRFVNPADAIAYGYQQQLAYARASQDALLGAIRRGNGLAATTHALAGTIGQNNFGQVQGQGADAYNASVAGYGGAVLTSGATIHAADTALQAHTDEVAEKHGEFLGTPVSTGQRPNPLGPFYPSLQEYGTPKYGGGMPTPVGDTAKRADAETVKVGTHVTQPDGVYPLKNGQTITVKGGQVSGVN